MALYAFNGTWNSEKTDVETTADNEYLTNTNVLKFRDACTSANGYYTNGVGTRFGRLGRVFGGAFGVGGQDRINDALDHLRAGLAAGHTTIDVVGFSRGAALALAFTNRVYKQVIDPQIGKPPVIRFLGLWDVVGSFGIPINLGPFLFQEYNLGYTLKLPPNVEHCFHAMALDERRQTFRVTRLKGACEVWFRGAHSDIGGGNGNIGLNNIAFTWMLRKAAACGLAVDQVRMLDASASCKPAADVLWPRDFVKNSRREIAADDRVHHTVAKGNHPDCNDPHTTCVVETITDELTATRAATFKP
jgi:uncharacterized protein (DUF2235 family)